MKILMCDNRLGGLLGFRADVIRHFVSEGHEVCLVAPDAVSEWDKIGLSCELSKKVRHIVVKMQPSGLNPIADLSLFFQYLRIFRRERPDIVFNYTIKPNIYSSLAASLVKCRVVCMLAGLGYMFSGDGFVKKLGRFLYKLGLIKAEKIFVLNQNNYDRLVDLHMVPKKKLILLSCGEGVNTDVYRFSPTDYSEGVVFLMVSRLLLDKGYHEFVETARKISFDKRFSKMNVSFEILGPTAYDSPMGVKIEQFESDVSSGLFRYLGVTDNVQSIIGRKNVVVVLPSKYGEGQNRSLMEACAMGRPVITTDIPGCKELVSSGKNGYIVPQADVDALVHAIEDFVMLPEKEKRMMGIEGRRFAENHLNVGYVIDHYESILKHKG